MKIIPYLEFDTNVEAAWIVVNQLATVLDAVEIEAHPDRTFQSEHVIEVDLKEASFPVNQTKIIKYVKDILQEKYHNAAKQISFNVTFFNLLNARTEPIDVHLSISGII